jgi:hypothetical protein
MSNLFLNIKDILQEQTNLFIDTFLDSDDSNDTDKYKYNNVPQKISKKNINNAKIFIYSPISCYSHNSLSSDSTNNFNQTTNDNVIHEINSIQQTNDTIIQQTINDNVNQTINDNVNQTINDNVNQTINDNVIQQTDATIIQQTINENVNNPYCDTTINEKLLDDNLLIKNMLLLAKIEINQKLNIDKTKDNFTIDIDNSFFPQISRWYNNQNREYTITIIHDLIDNVIYQYNCYKKINNQIYIKKYFELITNVINGLSNLKKTYSDDIEHILKINNILEKINNFIDKEK